MRYTQKRFLLERFKNSILYSDEAEYLDMSEVCIAIDAIQKDLSILEQIRVVMSQLDIFDDDDSKIKSVSVLNQLAILYKELGL